MTEPYEIQLPPLLNIPIKLLPIVLQIEHFRYFLLEGGRVSGKTQSVARLILTFGEMKKLRIVCGREVQATIEESVYQILVDLIEQDNLNYRVRANKIIHRISGTVITFKGFRDQGKVKIKGLEGVDILWIDEAQTISKGVLKILIPTIRGGNKKIFFTMNRYIENDPVFEEFSTFDRKRNGAKQGLIVCTFI